MASSFHPTRGNVLFTVLLAVALLGALTWAVLRATEQQSTLPATVQMDAQIQLLLSQGAALQGAVQKMVEDGQDPAALNTVLPAALGWDTAPHRMKIYHPFGGGIKYMAQTGLGAALSDKANLARTLKITPASSIAGVGPTDTGGDVLFTAEVSSLAACRRINKIVRGVSETLNPPSMKGGIFTAVFVNGTTQAVSDTDCPGCEGVGQSCVDNGAGTAWGYYQALLPR